MVRELTVFLIVLVVILLKGILAIYILRLLTIFF